MLASRALCQSVMQTSCSGSSVRTRLRSSVAKCPESGATDAQGLRATRRLHVDEHRPPPQGAAIRRTALLTVEGERDDICALGQTAAAHDLCKGVKPYMRRHHMQAGVGHYGVFSGKRWEEQVYPIVRNTVLASE